MPTLNAIGIASSDMARSIAFYRALGFDVPDTRGWTTKIGTDFLAEMVEMVEKEGWTD